MSKGLSGSFVEVSVEVSNVQGSRCKFRWKFRWMALMSKGLGGSFGGSFVEVSVDGM